MTAFPLVAAVAGTVATTAYLNAKYHIAHDISILRVAGDSSSTLKHLATRLSQKRPTTYHTLQTQAETRPSQVFLIFEGLEYTYREFFDCVTRAGNWLSNDLGVQKGEIVALNGGNSPEYMILWYALEGVGAIPSFVNCHIIGKSLVHCIQITIVYYDSTFLANLKDDTRLPSSRTEDRRLEDPVCLLYTSGSTGLPKAVTMLQGRELAVGHAVSRYLRLKPTDRMYTCMPLYHGAGHGLCVTPCINAGCTVVLGRKFSHRKFWPEVRESKANILQYVGELCRYLLNATPSLSDRQHSVKTAWGNGMRPDVWKKFQERFGIETINELYAATDGLGSSFNENRGEFTRNAIGKRGALWRYMKAGKEVIVRIDVDTEEMLRDRNGFAIKCGVNEPGETIHQLDPAAPDAAFHGYWKNRGAGEKRKIRDVFRKGDLWFRSGDMMRMDEDGRVYFVDRLGDTFRWKSENVSTNEVSDTLGSHPHVAEANVYGVLVPNADGRCGMAAIVMAEGISESSFDFKDLARHVLDTLPRYAVPYFLRITPELDYTGTLKMQKGRLKKEGIDVEAVKSSGDRVYWLPANGKEYVSFRVSDLEALKSGKVRL